MASHGERPKGPTTCQKGGETQEPSKGLRAQPAAKRDGTPKNPTRGPKASASSPKGRGTQGPRSAAQGQKQAAGKGNPRTPAAHPKGDDKTAHPSEPWIIHAEHQSKAQEGQLCPLWKSVI